MTVRPILFSAPMVRALLDGRKTQTRRVLKPQPFPVGGPFYRPHPVTAPREFHSVSAEGYITNIQTVRYAPGDLLWVREALDLFPGQAEYTADDAPVRANSRDAIDWIDRYSRMRAPGIHMPRWASRLTLAVTDVRVQRLQAISEADAIAEGLTRLKATGRYVVAKGDQYLGAAACDPRAVYSWLWDSIHAAGDWARNPWIVALTFEVHRENVDAFLARRQAA